MSSSNPPMQDASSTNPRPTASMPSGGTFSAFASATIHAPPAAVCNAIINIGDWKDWNSFVPSVNVTHQPASSQAPEVMQVGTKMTFKVSMTKHVSTVSKEIVSQLDPLKIAKDDSNDSEQQSPSQNPVTRIGWVMDNTEMMTPSFLMKAERVNEIEDLGDGTTLYRTWETFGGPAAHFVKWKYEQTLRDRFEDWVADLKKYVEGQHQVQAQEGT